MAKGDSDRAEKTDGGRQKGKGERESEYFADPQGIIEDRARELSNFRRQGAGLLRGGLRRRSDAVFV